MADTSQMAAIRHFKGPCLVPAGPGSGKTFVLTRRVRELVTVRHIPPESILVLTFSRNAAANMRQRYASSVSLPGSDHPSDILNVHFSTFHSFCRSLLNEYLHRPVNIIDNTAKRELLENICSRYVLSLSSGAKDGSAGLEFGSEAVPVKELERLISLRKNSRPAAGFALTCHFEAIFEEYNTYLAGRGQMDLDDLQLRCLNELEKGGIRPDIRFLLIDEFQDVSPVQFRIAQLLLDNERSVFAVGDEDQSIYGFRGAEPDIFRKFMAVYPDAAMISLDTNYRCAESVTERSMRVIRHNRIRQDKRIRAGSGIKGKTECAAFSSVQDEYRAICRKIRTLGDGKACILVRTVHQARTMLQCLKEEGLEADGRRKDSPAEDAFSIIRKDLLCYLNVSMHIAGSGVPAADLERILNHPERRLALPYTISGAQAPGRLLTAADLMEQERTRHIPDPALYALIERLVFAGRLRPEHWFRYIMKTLDYETYIRNAVLPACSAGEELLPERFLGISRIASTLSELERILKDMPVPAAPAQTADTAQRVSVLTMHGAKGMEFDTVFMPDLNEGIIPARSARDLPSTEEERRLFYVAMTRTRRQLFMSFIKNEAHTAGPPSRFLMETGLPYSEGEWLS